jgi:hypothetical protein
MVRGNDPFKRTERSMPLLDHFHPPLHGPRRGEVTVRAANLHEELFEILLT